MWANWMEKKVTIKLIFGGWYESTLSVPNCLWNDDDDTHINILDL